MLFPALASALPIQVTDKVIVKQLLQPKPKMMPARAGWYGPEIRPQDQFNLAYEQFGPPGTAWKVKRDLASAAIPRWEWLAVIALTVVFVRFFAGLMKPENQQHATRVIPISNETIVSDDDVRAA